MVANDERFIDRFKLNTLLASEAVFRANQVSLRENKDILRLLHVLSGVSRAPTNSGVGMH